MVLDWRKVPVSIHSCGKQRSSDKSEDETLRKPYIKRWRRTLNWPRLYGACGRVSNSAIARITYKKWLQTNTGILQLCPNVVHVELRGSELCEFDALLSVLKEKSLVSFSISSWYLPHRKSDQIFRFSKIFDEMKNWPALRSIQVESFYALTSCIIYLFSINDGLISNSNFNSGHLLLVNS